MNVFSNWTLHVVRRDGLESHSLDLRRGRVFVILTGMAVSLMGLGVAGGRF